MINLLDPTPIGMKFNLELKQGKTLLFENFVFQEWAHIRIIETAIYLHWIGFLENYQKCITKWQKRKKEQMKIHKCQSNNHALSEN